MSERFSKSLDRDLQLKFALGLKLLNFSSVFVIASIGLLIFFFNCIIIPSRKTSANQIQIQQQQHQQQQHQQRRENI